MNLSVVVPIYNEIENVSNLYESIDAVVSRLDREYEIILVDDGSTDGTRQKLRDIAKEDPQVKLVLFRRNFGQTAAMHAGIQYASGDVIVTLDGDLQNDPTDIPMMLDKIDEGFDLVHGWRKNRQDDVFSRTIPSKIANAIISWTTGFKIHDLGCTLKAIRREIAQELELYGEMHRFIPILAHRNGARCAEVVVSHHPRTAGVTKYGIDRTFRVVLDLITVKYMLDYFASPMKLFGMIGLWMGGLGMLAGVGTIAMKAIGIDMTGNPLLLLTIFSMMTSVQFMSLGLLGEVNARIYYSRDDKETYAVRDTVNFHNEDDPHIKPFRRAA